MATTISISEETRDILRNAGSKGETYDEIIKRMSTAYEEFLARQYKKLDEKNKFKKMVF